MIDLIAVALGMIMIFLFASLLVTAAQELIASGLSLRAKGLERSLNAIFDGKTEEIDKFKQQALVKALYGAGGPTSSAAGSRPSYLPAQTFSNAILNLARGAQQAPLGIAELKAWAETTESGPIGKIVKSLIVTGEESVGDVQKSLESWFDGTMDRLGGWFKRWSQVIGLLTGFLVAVIFNVDAINAWNALSTQPALRSALAAYAETVGKTGTAPSLEAMQAQLDKIKFPIGWPKSDQDGSGVAKVFWVAKPAKPADKPALPGAEPSKAELEFDVAKLVTSLLGWIITALAASLGAVFWFDLLKRFIQIRSAGPKPPTSPADPATSDLLRDRA